MLPRQVANLVRFTSADTATPWTAAADNGDAADARDTNISTDGSHCDSGVVGDATFAALVWALGLGDSVVSGGGLGSSLAVAEALLRGTGRKVHVIGPWGLTASHSGYSTVTEADAAAAWGVADDGANLAAAERQLGLVRPCGGGKLGRARFKVAVGLRPPRVFKSHGVETQ